VVQFPVCWTWFTPWVLCSSTDSHYPGVFGTSSVKVSTTALTPPEVLLSAMDPTPGGKSDGLRFLLTNAFSLRNKMGDFQHVVAKYDVFS